MKVSDKTLSDELVVIISLKLKELLSSLVLAVVLFGDALPETDTFTVKPLGG